MPILIQIQHLLKLNFFISSLASSITRIQIQHLLKLNSITINSIPFSLYSNTTFVKVKCIIMCTISISTKYSNTTFVKVKLYLYKLRHVGNYNSNTTFVKVKLTYHHNFWDFPTVFKYNIC